LGPKKIEKGEGRSRDDAVDPRQRIGELAQPRPFESGADDKQRNQTGEPGARQEVERGEESGDQDRRSGDPRSERAFQAAPARLVAEDAAATCSLVRPKRRSRLAYEAIAWSSAAASKSGHSVSVK
jgi:hypothetical protein